MALFSKNLTVPSDNSTSQIEAVQLWEVRWVSRYGEYHNNTRTEVEVFTSQEAAEHFAEALKNAFKLIRHTSGNSVQITKAKSY